MFSLTTNKPHYLLSILINRYIKNTHRSRLRDELASATLHLQQLRKFIDVENLQSSDSLVLDYERALTHVQNTLEDIRNKYLDTRISRNFTIDGEERVYAGTINHINWSRGDGCYLFHVSYADMRLRGIWYQIAYFPESAKYFPESEKYFPESEKILPRL